MATLCAVMLAENGHAVRLWSAFPEAAAELARTRRNARFLPQATLPESVEVTPDAVRVRKKVLQCNLRIRRTDAIEESQAVE